MVRRIEGMNSSEVTKRLIKAKHHRDIDYRSKSVIDEVNVTLEEATESALVKRKKRSMKVRLPKQRND